MNDEGQFLLSFPWFFQGGLTLKCHVYTSYPIKILTCYTSLGLAFVMVPLLGFLKKNYFWNNNEITADSTLNSQVSNSLTCNITQKGFKKMVLNDVPNFKKYQINLSQNKTLFVQHKTESIYTKENYWATISCFLCINIAMKAARKGDHLQGFIFKYTWNTCGRILPEEVWARCQEAESTILPKSALQNLSWKAVVLRHVFHLRWFSECFLYLILVEMSQQEWWGKAVVSSWQITCQSQ